MVYMTQTSAKYFLIKNNIKKAAATTELNFSHVILRSVNV
jgi:hypothetical protein